MKLPALNGMAPIMRRCQILLSMIPILGLALFASPLQAQVCNGTSTVGFPISQPQPIIVGETYEVRVTLRAEQITTNTGGAGNLGISKVRYEMDCDGSGQLFCTPDNNTVTYQGPATITDTTCLDAGNSPVTFAVTLAGAPNDKQLILSPSATVVLTGTTAENTIAETCRVDLLLSVDVLNDANVVQAGGYSNAVTPSDAFCDSNNDGIFGNSNDIATGAQNTLQLTPITCEPELDKYVCVDTTGDGNTDTCFGEGEMGGSGATLSGKAWEFYVDYENAGTGTLSDCTLTDSNAGEILTGLTLQPGDSASGVLVDSATCTVDTFNTATLTCGTCGVTEQPFEASDTSDVQCLDCAVEVDRQVACELPPEYVDVIGDDDSSDDDFSRLCTGWNGVDEVSLRWTVENTGGLDVVQCSLTDTAYGAVPVFGEDPANMMVSDPVRSFSDEGLLCDPLENDDSALLNCVCAPFIDGVNIVDVPALGLSTPDNPITSFGGGWTGDPEDDPCLASDSDAAEIQCKTASVNVTKTCDDPVEGSNLITITVENDSDAAGDGWDLENCAVTDTLDPDGDSADLTTLLTWSCEDAGGSVPIGDFDLDIDEVVTCTALLPSPDETVLNRVDVTCDIVGSKKTVSDFATDECNPDGDGCFTRTPGYWGTHPESTDWALGDGVYSCGVWIDQADTSKPGVQGSAIEDMCSIGKDHKSAQTTNSQLNLERHCMAARLNLEASDLLDGSCESEIPGITEAFAECCGFDDGDSVCSTGGEFGDRSITECIGVIGAFNEWSTGDELDDTDLCPSDITGFTAPCKADSSECREAKGNGFVNEGRDREAKCTGKSCNGS